MLQGQADDQQDQLELRRRDGNLAVWPRRIQERLLERHPVALRQVVADDQLVVRVDVDQAAGLGVAPVVVEDAGQSTLGAQGQLEAEAMQHRREAVLIRSRDQQVKVVLARARAIQKGVALEVAPGNALGRQLGAQVVHERDRPRPIGSVAPRAVRRRPGACVSGRRRRRGLLNPGQGTRNVTRNTGGAPPSNDSAVRLPDPVKITMSALPGAQPGRLTTSWTTGARFGVS